MPIPLKINKRKNVKTPSQIVNYNLFLQELDKKQQSIINTKHTENLNDIFQNNNKINNPEKCEQLTSQQCCSIQRLSDIKLREKKGIIDRNTILTERNHCKHGEKLIHASLVVTKKEKTSKVQIDTPINNISDLIQIIENNEDNETIDYNIDIHALHKIKEPLIKLNSMIGIKALKEHIVDQILYYIQNLHKITDTNTSSDFMHTVIYGEPGTGKTEIAKIIGSIFSKLGILKNNIFKKVTRSDLIAGYLGQTAIKTKDAIKDSIGGVLFIDEAYSLGNSEKKDSFSKECIDTLCESLSDHKDDLMVIIAGYEKELKECFFNYNKGLESRFTWRFETEPYNAEELYKIFLKMINDIGWSINENIHKSVIKWFEINKDHFKYFGRDIETLLSKIKISHSKRVFCLKNDEKRKIILIDIENGFKIYLKNKEKTTSKLSETALSMYS